MNIEKFITLVGDGGKGGSGGYAGNGHNGKDGTDASEENTVPFYSFDDHHLIKGTECTRGGDGGRGGHAGDVHKNNTVRFFPFYGHHLTKGTEGTRGGDGGRGADAGLGAFGGHAGDVHIEENQRLITMKFAEIIESKDKSNTNGELGLPGQGGKGGSDGNDILYVKGYYISKNEAHREHIELVDTEDSFFGEYKVNFKFKKKIVKSYEMEIISGKSTDVQLKTH
ncbi:unnamed protein product [Didymodactylos carnosus]|uniref:Uncharacterized protein n=1 Tax=Didymodactylos carnosus TaxID=1234261 RepID=A0A8S2DQS6_9BILA|nr:unnamed protein product [Didymodactylos carnosus]CAF3795686.1 unnamed protein product [Didymodactylos carnosus]